MVFHMKGAGCCWTVPEMMMWMSCTGAWVSGMFMVWKIGQWDFFRLFFFASPGIVTAFVTGPSAKDKSFGKLLGFGSFMFIFYWMIMQAYPCQCRHAWGTMMVSDTSYDDTAVKKALLKERDTFYKMGKLEGLEDGVFNPPNMTSNENDNSFTADPNSHVNVDYLYTELQKMSAKEEAADGARQMAVGAGGGGVTNRVKKWVSPLTGADSMDILKLRAYCHMHANDPALPAIFPFRAIGLPAHYTTTLPCPYWSCVMTEARPDGKLVFWVSLALVGLLNYLHYRLECHCFPPVSKILGSGQSRIWWAWFWACFVPLWIVMLIRTTYDEELTEFIMDRFTDAKDTIVGWFAKTENKATVGVLFLGVVLIKVYWEKVRHLLGLDHHTFLPQLFSRAQDDGYERVVQVCVWRIDLSADDATAPSRGESNEDTDNNDAGNNRWAFLGGNARSDSRNASISRAWTPMQLVQGGALGDIFKGEEDMSTIRTSDGRIPCISVHFVYGSETLQYTRNVRPTWAEWRNRGSVYIQENFKVALEWRPNVPLRVEVKDMEAALGPCTLGEAVFDSRKLLLQMEHSKKREAHFTDVPVVQVIEMLKPPVQSNFPQQQRDVLNGLTNVGFQKHALSGGGSIWLAFSDVASSKKTDMTAFCCA